MPTTLREARRRRRLTLVEVARDLGTHPSTLSRIECGKTPVDRQMAARLYAYYGGEVDLHEVCHIPRLIEKGEGEGEVTRTAT